MDNYKIIGTAGDKLRVSIAGQPEEVHLTQAELDEFIDTGALPVPVVKSRRQATSIENRLSAIESRLDSFPAIDPDALAELVPGESLAKGVSQEDFDALAAEFDDLKEHFQHLLEFAIKELDHEPKITEEGKDAPGPKVDAKGDPPKAGNTTAKK